MALNVNYSSTPHVGSVAVSATANTSFAASVAVSNTVTVITGVATGTEVNDIVFVGTATYGSGTTVAGQINLWLYNGTTYTPYDSVLVPAVAPTSSTSQWRFVKPYNNLNLASASWSLVATSTVASQLVQITADASDY